MSNGGHVLLLTTEEETRRAVSQASGTVTNCGDLNELGTFLEDAGTAVALVDIDAVPAASLSNLEPLVNRYPKTRFVVLTNEVGNEMLLEAMQIGARHCLVKTTLSNDLPIVLKRLSGDAAGEGQVVTVLTAGGGAGGTTLAFNLAEELRLSSKEPALLVDLDVHYGAAATYMGVEGRFGVADVLAHDGSLDAELMRSTAAVYNDDFHVLLSPSSIDFGNPSPVAWGRLNEAMAAWRHAYPCTVVDAPRVTMDVAAELARGSAMTLVVFELAVIDIRATREILAALRQRNVPMDTVLPVANRFRKRYATISIEDAVETLGGVEVARVSNDYPSAMRSINFGRPLSEVAPRSSMRLDIQELATQVRKTHS